MKLTILTIGYKNDKDFILTSDSLQGVLSKGVVNIVQDGGGTFEEHIRVGQKYYFEKDTGIFNALNKGIAKVDTDYFMLIHSGDQLCLTYEELINRVAFMEHDNLDILLGDQTINTGVKMRFHGARFWRPWQLRFGNQPPHMPTIYRTGFAKKYVYNEENKIIGDFEYFEDLFSGRPNWEWFNGKPVILMGPGGNTSSGFKSLVLVSKCFIQNYGLIKGFIMALLRIPFKLLMMIK